MMFVFSKKDVRPILENNPYVVVDAFKQLCEDDSNFLSSIEQTTKSITANRIRLTRWCDVLNVKLNLNLKVPAF
jgi:hypothetical protein